MKKVDCKLLGDLCEFLLDGEPVFIIRAHDAAAIPSLKNYLVETKELRGGNTIRTSAMISRFKSWQESHKDFVRPAD